jgi:hypothetical protein
MVTSAKSPLQMRDALLPLVGAAGYRDVLTAMYHKDLLQAAGLAPALVSRVEAYALAHGVEALPRQEVRLESDSKSRIYVIQTWLDQSEHFYLVLKWYRGKRQPFARIEQEMNAYFHQALASYCSVGPILAVVPLPAADPFSVAIMPYLGEVTLYDHLHEVSPHTPQVETLLRQASETLAYAQVLGCVGHVQQAIRLTSLAPAEAPAYFLGQISGVLLRTFADSGQPIPMADALLAQFTFFAELLAADSCAAGLYYRGINPRNIMWVDGQQVEIDFEQDTLRSRCIDIVSLLENGLEMQSWDNTADYPAFAGQMPFKDWQMCHRRAWDTLAQYNYLSHQQVEALTSAFLDTTLRLEREYLPGARPLSGPGERRLLLESVRLFRHLQYVGYCKRNEQQALTASKRTSSQYRQRFHALWAKCALDRLLYPACPEDVSLPPAGREAATALRRTLDALPLDS